MDTFSVSGRKESIEKVAYMHGTPLLSKRPYALGLYGEGTIVWRRGYRDAESKYFACGGNCGEGALIAKDACSGDGSGSLRGSIR